MAHYVLICGGRDYADRDAIAEKLTWLYVEHGNDLRVIHGAAPGADTIAGELCHTFGISCRDYPADWIKYGNGAGPVRNRHMARLLHQWQQAGHTVEVVAFPGGRGTADMVRVAESYGFPIEHPQ